MSDHRVRDLMHAPVLTCGPEMPVAEVGRMMTEARVHAIVVTGIERTPWAVISARDVLRAAPGGRLRAVDLAATEVLTVDAEADAAEAARLLVEHEVDHVLVLDGAGRPAGIVSTLDLVGDVAGRAADHS